MAILTLAVEAMATEDYLQSILGKLRNPKQAMAYSVKSKEYSKQIKFIYY